MEISRREFLKYGGAAALALALDKEYFMGLTLDDVKSGKASPESYLSQKFKAFPELAGARGSGILKGFMYEPSGDELRSKMHELLEYRTSNEETLKRLIEITMEDYDLLESKGWIASIFPGIVHVFGKEVPHYIACNEKLFDNRVINKDEDVRALLGKHMIRHVEDFYDGITLGLGDLYLSIDEIKAENFGLENLISLMELRASHDILEDVFKGYFEKKSVSISEDLFLSEADNYIKYWKSLEEKARTDLEKRARDLQFGEFWRLEPKRVNGGFSLNYNPDMRRKFK